MRAIRISSRCVLAQLASHSGCVLAAMLACVLSTSLLAQQPPPGKAAAWERQNQVEQRLRAALSKRTSVELLATPLDEAIALLADKTELPIFLDRRALDDIGLGVDEPVNLNVREMPLKQVFKLIGQRFGLTYQVRNEVIEITSNEAAETHLQHAVIPIGEILAGIDSNRELLGLRDTLELAVAPESWASVGGPASLSMFGKSLIVAQSEANLDELRQALAAIHKIKAGSYNSIEASAAPAVEQALGKTATLEFLETPLSDTLHHISQTYDLPIMLDDRSLNEEGIPSDTPVTVRVQHVSLRSALRLALHSASPQLVFESWPNLLRVTTDAARSLHLKIYPVGDLCANEDAAVQLQRVITETVAPDSWDSYGGEGVVSRLGVRQQTLVIRQYGNIHNEIEGLLKRMRQAKAESGDDADDDQSAPEAMILRGYTVSVEADALTEVQAFLKEEMPKAWGEEGARLSIIAGQLVIRQRESVHRHVREVLQQLGIFIAPLQKGMVGGGGMGGGGLGGGGFF